MKRHTMRAATMIALTVLIGCAAHVDPVKYANKTDFQFRIHDYDPQKEYHVYFKSGDNVEVKLAFIRKSADPNKVTLVSQRTEGYVNADVFVSDIVLVTGQGELQQSMGDDQRKQIALIALGSLLLAGLIGAIFYVDSQ